MSAIQNQFAALLWQNAKGASPPMLTPALARKLTQRLDGIRLFAHGYTLLTNLTHGRATPWDLLDFAWRHELQGVCLHVLDGGRNSLSGMDDQARQAFGLRAREFGLDLHLEISSTLRPDLDQAVAIALATGSTNIRVYSRYEGLLSEVMARIEADLRYISELADRHGLNFDFEQHEELKSHEIATLLRRINHPRLNALFDFGNMINANEQPLPALQAMAPLIRQVHLKGVRIVPQGKGTGHYGVLQGSAQDDLPGPRMLYELLMLGEDAPQVIAFALEQENHYAAPAFRMSDEADDPFIPYREMSDTVLPPGHTLDSMMAAEHRWLENQLDYMRGLIRELRLLAALVLAEAEQPCKPHALVGDQQ
ncbi:sugar phosphate isomerase/epimerase [Paracoccus sp. PAR01]|uniref:sugar phosphate isomerase/epimerase family protein n=1 Tax=Paracoccus sp. PAR01 TaxID=2769282 RepID=UPI0017838A9B|nr:TIM barrel protein [Paracoccus sp. PAR01]MBD9527633.1 TIM barrel protein [Paracoccus sp. PAR01]